MKALVQRVLKASVSVGDEIISSIGPGLCVFIGISRKDGPKDAEFLARKLLNLRVFEDHDGRKWDKNVMEMKFDILCVSQFTLQSTIKGYKPDFHNAMNAEDSEQFYDNFIQQLREGYGEEKIKDGRFGAMMQVNITNDGPVTIPIETPVNIQEKKKPDKWGVGKRDSKGSKKGKDVKDQVEPNVNEGASGTSADMGGANSDVGGGPKPDVSGIEADVGGAEADLGRAKSGVGGTKSDEGTSVDAEEAKSLNLDGLNLNER